MMDAGGETPLAEHGCWQTTATKAEAVADGTSLTVRDASVLGTGLGRSAMCE
jgi:hypothetical protein